MSLGTPRAHDVAPSLTVYASTKTGTTNGGVWVLYRWEGALGCARAEKQVVEISPADARSRTSREQLERPRPGKGVTTGCSVGVLPLGWLWCCSWPVSSWPSSRSSWSFPAAWWWSPCWSGVSPRRGMRSGDGATSGTSCSSQWRYCSSQQSSSWSRVTASVSVSRPSRSCSRACRPPGARSRSTPCCPPPTHLAVRSWCGTRGPAEARPSATTSPTRHAREGSSRSS